MQKVCTWAGARPLANPTSSGEGWDTEFGDTVSFGEHGELLDDKLVSDSRRRLRPRTGALRAWPCAAACPYLRQSV